MVLTHRERARQRDAARAGTLPAAPQVDTSVLLLTAEEVTRGVARVAETLALLTRELGRMPDSDDPAQQDRAHALLVTIQQARLALRYAGTVEGSVREWVKG